MKNFLDLNSVTSIRRWNVSKEILKWILHINARTKVRSDDHELFDNPSLKAGVSKYKCQKKHVLVWDWSQLTPAFRAGGSRESTSRIRALALNYRNIYF